VLHSEAILLHGGYIVNYGRSILEAVKVHRELPDELVRKVVDEREDEAVRGGDDEL